MNENIEKMMRLASIMAGMSILFQNPRKPKAFRLGGQAKESHPWDTIQLSKAERKGKSYQDLQLLRFQKWKRQKELQ